jgi:ABC-type iron transport system FetAB ATPase subunit
LAGEAEILRGVTFAVQAGEVFSVVGPSGAGKSTLLRTINRLVESTAGNIFLDGVPIEEINPLELRRRIGMVFQLPALFGDTVEDTVLYGVRPPYLRTQALYWIGLVSAVLFAGAGLSLPALALGARWEDALKPAVLSSPLFGAFVFFFILSLDSR